jgi:7,8-didemethyl-8-hydroxy-5-deazariboflavin synthase CofG subunit
MVLAGYPAGRVGRGQEQSFRFSIFTKDFYMVVGYALGNRNDQENDVLVLGEDNKNVVTFSSSLTVNLARACMTTCQECNFQRKELISFPYSTIKIAKEARSFGVREVLYKANSRPDQYSQIRSSLELWGFDSYVDYLYTVCELGFLEGLIPIVELGFLTPDELRHLSALVKICLSTSQDLIHESYFKWEKAKRLNRRLKNIEWASKLKFPMIISILVSEKDRPEINKSHYEFIKSMHEQYGMVHEVVFEAFEPSSFVKVRNRERPSIEKLMGHYAFAKSILPEDIPVILPANAEHLDILFENGIKDLGSIKEFSYGASGKVTPYDWEKLDTLAKSKNIQIQQRFPLRKEFIKQEKYSKKLGQVFDAYRYKIKKEAQERLREIKA